MPIVGPLAANGFIVKRKQLTPYGDAAANRQGKMPQAENIKRLLEALRSKRGKSVITFLVFIVISTVLWTVQTLNEETQRDVRCTVKITNVPDSLVRVTQLPEAFNVSVRARGTQLMRYWWTQQSRAEIDYRMYKADNRIQFNEAALKAFFRNCFGASSQILSVTPDTLSIAFTSRPGVMLPVHVDAHITPAPQFIVVGKCHSLVDSVIVYSLDPLPAKVRSISTEPINLKDVRKSQVMKVPLVAPARSRVVPDSLEVRFDVEPLVSKVRKVPVTPVNVPEGMRLIPVPSQVEVYYMVPMEIYKNTDNDPKFRVEADYRSIAGGKSDKVAVHLTKAPDKFTNVFLSTDSIDYILEQK